MEVLIALLLFVLSAPLLRSLIFILTTCSDSYLELLHIMGNAQSDMGEKEAYDRVIKFIPFVSVGYSSIRAFVYLGKANDAEAA